MSRVGNLPLAISSGVDVQIADSLITVKGVKGILSFSLPQSIFVSRDGDTLVFSREGEDKHIRSCHGMSRAMVANMIEGVSKGFEKKLQIIGVGYKAQATGKKITLNLGFSHSIDMDAPDGVEVSMDPEEKNLIVVKGFDKQLVGEFSANIRKLRKPEPYKGKGIRYLGEYVKRKAGKTAGKK